MAFDYICLFCGESTFDSGYSMPGNNAGSRTCCLKCFNKNSKRIWLDDERPAPYGWLWVESPNDVIHFIIMGNVEEISLDHDLCGIEQTGYDVLIWLEKVVCDEIDYMPRDFKPPKIRIHTANPVAAEKMYAAKDNIDKIQMFKKLRNNIGKNLIPQITDAERQYVDTASEIGFLRLSDNQRVVILKIAEKYGIDTGCFSKETDRVKKFKKKYNKGKLLD